MERLKQLALLALVSVVLSSGCKKDEKAVVFPLVVSTIPTDKAVDVPFNQIITATFDKKMDAATITQASFIVQQGTTAVAGTVSYSGLVASFTPSGPLTPNTLYAGTIKTLVKDELGNALQSEYKWSFTTMPQVTLSSNPAAGGTTIGAGTFAKGSAVTVTASPNTGYSFVNWTEGTDIVSPDASYTSPLNANRILVANFAINTYALNVTATNGTVAKNPDLAAYTSGATVQLTATPNSGYKFALWSGDATGSTNPLPVILTGNKNITANFTALAGGLTLTVTATYGTVVKNPDLVTYTTGTSVQLTAMPNSGYTFASWGGSATGSTNPLTVSMSANKYIIANFTAISANTYTLNASATNGTVVRSPVLETYNSGAYVKLTATPNSGYRFTSWSGDVTGDTNPLTITMNANKNITANFTPTDTKALQALIDQCPTNGTVILPAGTYYIDAVAALNLKSNMTLKMESGTILMAIANSNTNSNIIKISGVTNVNVEGGTLIGERDSHIGTTGEWGMGIGIYSGTNVKITDVIAKDCWGDGFFVGYNSNTITFDHVTGDHNRRQGLSNSGGDNVVIKNSTFKNTFGTDPQYGIDIEPDAGYTAHNNQIINCQLTGNAGGGIDVNGMWPTAAIPSTINNLVVTGNTCSNNSRNGIIIVRTSGHSITNNICLNNGNAGINLTQSTGVTVSSNTCKNNGVGILLNNGATGNTIIGNTVTGNTSSQIVDEFGGNTISGNTTQ